MALRNFFRNVLIVTDMTGSLARSDAGITCSLKLSNVLTLSAISIWLYFIQLSIIGLVRFFKYRLVFTRGVLWEGKWGGLSRGEVARGRGGGGFGKLP